MRCLLSLIIKSQTINKLKRYLSHQHLNKDGPSFSVSFRHRLLVKFQAFRSPEERNHCLDVQCGKVYGVDMINKLNNVFSPCLRMPMFLLQAYTHKLCRFRKLRFCSLISIISYQIFVLQLCPCPKARFSPKTEENTLPNTTFISTASFLVG